MCVENALPWARESWVSSFAAAGATPEAPLLRPMGDRPDPPRCSPDEALSRLGFWAGEGAVAAAGGLWGGPRGLKASKRWAAAPHRAFLPASSISTWQLCTCAFNGLQNEHQLSTSLGLYT